MIVPDQSQKIQVKPSQPEIDEKSKVEAKSQGILEAGRKKITAVVSGAGGWFSSRLPTATGAALLASPAGATVAAAAGVVAVAMPKGVQKSIQNQIDVSVITPIIQPALDRNNTQLLTIVGDLQTRVNDNHHNTQQQMVGLTRNLNTKEELYKSKIEELEKQNQSQKLRLDQQRNEIEHLNKQVNTLDENFKKQHDALLKKVDDQAKCCVIL